MAWRDKRYDIKSGVELSPASEETFSPLLEMQILWALIILAVQVQTQYFRLRLSIVRSERERESMMKIDRQTCDGQMDGQTDSQ